MAVNYGKTGTCGKYIVKEFDNTEICEKEVRKLIVCKTKKGYQSFSEFDAENHFYFDDDKVGLHPLTSHPKFRAYFTDELYYDCTDEEAPFGSDEGSDALAEIEKKLRKNANFQFGDFPKSIIETLWDMLYIPVESLDVDSVKLLIEKDEMNVFQSDIITASCAFAQIKITGRLSEELKQRALIAMQRIKITATLLEWETGFEIIDKMIVDLTAFM